MISSTATYGDTILGKETFKAGEVFCRRKFSNLAWQDCIILGFENEQVFLSRPYAYVSGIGTTSLSILMGRKVFSNPKGPFYIFYPEV